MLSFLSNIPRELRLSPAERAHIRRRMFKRLLAHPRDIARFYATALLPPLVFLGVIGLIVALSIESGLLLNPANPRTYLFLTLLGGGKFAAIPILLFSLYIANKHYYRPHMLAVLREMNYETCDGCGYMLRGLDDDSDQCPECGRRRRTTSAP